MTALDVKRLDHHGIVAGAFDSLGLEKKINEVIGIDPQERVTPGQAVKAMVLCGLGFSNRPMMLTPQFFSNLPTELLIGPGIGADELNRHKLGRTLDALHEHGCEALFSLLATQACDREGVQRDIQSLDTTSFSLTGEYAGGDSGSANAQQEMQEVHVCHGYSKDHRPDLKQVVTELVVSQDGGVPLMLECHDGNASDTRVFEARSTAMVKSLKNGPALSAWVGDSKLYSASNAAALKSLPFITRIPRTIKQEQSCVRDACKNEEGWQPHASQKGLRYQRVDLTHMDIAQRWLVVSSDAARARAQKSVEAAVKREEEALKKALFHFSAKRFSCVADAQKALAELGKGRTFHTLSDPAWTEHRKYKTKGRPRKDMPPTETLLQGQADYIIDNERVESTIETKACFVVGTRVSSKEMSDDEVITTYKNQSAVEGGFRFLKDPMFFTSSLFVKKESRMEALLMVMTIALLVYSIAQRRLRAALAKAGDTLPNQIDLPDAKPTLRWVFQFFEGVSVVTLESQTVFHGLSDVRVKTLRYFGWSAVLAIYQISPESG